MINLHWNSQITRDPSRVMLCEVPPHTKKVRWFKCLTPKYTAWWDFTLVKIQRRKTQTWNLSFFRSCILSILIKIFYFYFFLNRNTLYYIIKKYINLSTAIDFAVLPKARWQLSRVLDSKVCISSFQPQSQWYVKFHISTKCKSSW